MDFNGVPMSPVIARKAMELMLANPIKTNFTAKTDVLNLTPREIDILKELGSGASYNIIGEKLFISPLTVRKHVANLYEKLHVSTRMQVVNIAQQNHAGTHCQAALMQDRSKPMHDILEGSVLANVQLRCGHRLFANPQSRPANDVQRLAWSNMREHLLRVLVASS